MTRSLEDCESGLHSFIACLAHIITELQSGVLLTEELSAALRRGVNDIGRAIAESNAQVLARNKDHRNKDIRALSREFYSGKLGTRAREIAHDLTYPSTPKERGFESEKRKRWRDELSAINATCDGRIPGPRMIEKILKAGQWQ